MGELEEELELTFKVVYKVLCAVDAYGAERASFIGVCT